MTHPLVDITHRMEFSAAHRLHADALSEAENLELYGPCNTMHGHNYAVEVTVRGGVDPGTGMVMNLTRLMEVMHRELWTAVDHKCLNTDVPFLDGIIPTAENLAVAFWDRMEACSSELPGARLARVRVVESRSNFVDYYGPQERTHA